MFKNRYVKSTIKLWPSSKNSFSQNVVINMHSTGNVGDPDLQWNIFGGHGVGSADSTSGIVAVLDTGLHSHGAFQQRILPGADLVSNLVSANDGDGRDMDSNDPGDFLPDGESCEFGGGSNRSSWHGTHVAGILAMSDPQMNLYGVSRKLNILPVRVLGRCGGSLRDLVDGILWAIGIKVDGLELNEHLPGVLNLSLGAIGDCPKALQEVIYMAKNMGVAIVASSGNSGYDLSERTVFPSSCLGVLSVGATNEMGERAPYSNFGGDNIVYAPGGSYARGILSTTNTGATVAGEDFYVEMIGTSMAAPHVSGLILNLLHDFPELRPSDVQDVLLEIQKTQNGPVNYDAARSKFAEIDSDEFGFSELLSSGDGSRNNFNGVSKTGQKNSAVGCGAISTHHKFELIVSFMINFLIYQIIVYSQRFLKQLFRPQLTLR